MSKSSKNPVLDSADKLLRILLWEAGGGVVKQPSWAKDYKKPDMEFKQRVDLVKTAYAAVQIADKVATEKPETGFSMLKEMMNGSGENAHRRNPFQAEWDSSAGSESSS